jgi:bifunctional UDP-N-acetylglucosamine pyrophosphorylase/glucosamine-1-phosphate N-acetyltransferase
VNAGVYCVDMAWLRGAIRQLRRHNAQGEYYLTDIVALADQEGRPFSVVCADTPQELLGMNTRAESARIHQIKRRQIADRHMDAGVDIVDPDHIYIDDTVKIEAGSHLGPGVCLMGQTRIGTNVYIHAYSVVQDAVVGDGVVIGPFGRLRPGAVLDDNVHIGNFVEIKKSRLGKGAKANHLSYIGDADIGAGTNVGCGTITCNYDGVQKHRTKIGKNVFIGSDVAFVAPVVVKDGAIIGAGSVITDTVPANALAIARGRQVTIKGWKRKSKKR